MAIVQRNSEPNAEKKNKLGECVSLLLENYFGIGVSFNLNPFDDKDIKAIEGIDFSGKILLGARIFDRFKEINRTLKKAIFTVDKFESKLPGDQNLALVEVNKMKDICNKIASHCKEYDDLRSSGKLRSSQNSVGSNGTLRTSSPELQTSPDIPSPPSPTRRSP